MFIDPDGRDAIYIAFPDYKISFAGTKWSNLGHAGVLLIDNKTGVTKYYDYGRYDTKDGTVGRVRSSSTDKELALSNVVIDKKTGKPTQESLNKVLAEISKNAGQSGKIDGAYIDGDFSEMNEYAKQKMKESNSKYTKEYDKQREEYSIWTNNCGTFAADVVNQDPAVEKKAPSIIDPRPNSIVKEYQDNFKSVTYDPKTNKTTLEE
jgi:hypothetical protein